MQIAVAFEFTIQHKNYVWSGTQMNL